MTILEPVRRAASRRPPAPAEDDFTSRLRNPAVAARIGIWLGVTFTVAFLTGIVSHWAQSPTPWFPFPSRPAWGYRVTQGLHVISGTAAIPLLLVKLWTVYPRLFASLGRGARQLLLAGLERLSIAVLVASADLPADDRADELRRSGTPGSSASAPPTSPSRGSRSAPWSCTSRSSSRSSGPLWASRSTPTPSTATARPVATGRRRCAVTRAGLLRSTWLASGVAVLASAGSTVPWLRDVSVLGVRSGDGPQGLPVNKSARAGRGHHDRPVAVVRPGGPPRRRDGAA